MNWKFWKRDEQELIEKNEDLNTKFNDLSNDVKRLEETNAKLSERLLYLERGLEYFVYKDGKYLIGYDRFGEPEFVEYNSSHLRYLLSYPEYETLHISNLDTFLRLTYDRAVRLAEDVDGEVVKACDVKE